MKIPFYHIDSFTDTVFRGNPAGVCLLEEWLADEVMLGIAAENKVSETAFIVKEDEGYRIRWFTPEVEVDLCGHATLASGYVMLNRVLTGAECVVFQSASGELTVRRDGERMVMDFPARPGVVVTGMDAFAEVFGEKPVEIRKGVRDHMLIYEDEEQVRQMTPDFAILETIDYEGVIITAGGNDCDFVSRFFAPDLGVPEDPVTGSAHCTLVPYWAERLGKTVLHARQVSSRGGELFCELCGNRVMIAGDAVVYLEGAIEI